MTSSNDSYWPSTWQSQKFALYLQLLNYTLLCFRRRQWRLTAPRHVQCPPGILSHHMKLKNQDCSGTIDTSMPYHRAGSSSSFPACDLALAVGPGKAAEDGLRTHTLPPARESSGILSLGQLQALWTFWSRSRNQMISPSFPSITLLFKQMNTS